MKKLLTLIAVLGLSVSLIGCGGAEKPAAKPTTTTGAPEEKAADAAADKEKPADAAAETAKPAEETEKPAEKTKEEN